MSRGTNPEANDRRPTRRQTPEGQVTFPSQKPATHHRSGAVSIIQFMKQSAQTRRRSTAILPHSSLRCTLPNNRAFITARDPSPAALAARYTILSFVKSTPSGAGGVLSFMSSNTFRMRSATTRLRYHFRLAGTIYQGAQSVLVAEMTSSNALR